MVTPMDAMEEAKQKKDYLFKVCFSKGDGAAKKDLMIACQGIEDRKGWIRAFHKYQLQIMEYKMKYFNERLEKQ